MPLPLLRSPRVAALAFLPLAAWQFSLTACQGGVATPLAEAPALDPFDADRAWGLLVEQVEIGPRPSGSEANAALRDLIARELSGYGLEPVREAFVAEETPAGPISMENVYADLAGEPGPDGEPAPMIVLGAHFDTKRLPFHFVGANDGASEVAVLLELARILAAGDRRPCTLRFLFLDGEEAVRMDWQDPDNRYGSRHHVMELTKRKGAIARTRAFIGIDMVGDRDLQLERDSNSKRELVKIFVDTAEELDMPDLFARYPLPIKDDHQSFARFGVPVVDLIDLRYGKVANEYWHTAEDTLDKCSKESLGKVGRLVLAALPKVEARYGQR